MKNIAVIIPAFNVEPTIGEVIDQTTRFIKPSHIIVIDDGSQDQTAVIARQTGSMVLQNGVNRGKGYALKKGFRYAIEKGFEAVITLDGDLQHDPLEIPNFIGCFEKINADLILGDRTYDFSAMPLDRQFSNKMTSLLISLLVVQRVRDSQSGYRLIKTEVLKRIKLTSNRYETESELLLKALLLGYKIASVPIKTIYNNQPSHIHRVIDTWRFLKVVLTCLIKR